MEPMALFPILSSWGFEVVGSTPDPEEGTRLKTSLVDYALSRDQASVSRAGT